MNNNNKLIPPNWPANLPLPPPPTPEQLSQLQRQFQQNHTLNPLSNTLPPKPVLHHHHQHQNTHESQPHISNSHSTQFSSRSISSTGSSDQYNRSPPPNRQTDIPPSSTDQGRFLGEPEGLVKDIPSGYLVDYWKHNQPPKPYTPLSSKHLTTFIARHADIPVRDRDRDLLVNDLVQLYEVVQSFSSASSDSSFNGGLDRHGWKQDRLHQWRRQYGVHLSYDA